MEPRKDLTPETKSEWAISLRAGPAKYFERAYWFTKTFYPDELAQIWSMRFDQLTPGRFFAEYIWVVHATGFNARVVGSMMPKLLAAYGTWEDLALEDKETALERILKVCNHPGKANAVRSQAMDMHETITSYQFKRTDPWEFYKTTRLANPKQLSKLPFIGPVTCMHLARNIGHLDFVKPDLHLIRLAEYWSFPGTEKGVTDMCRAMQESHALTEEQRLPLGIVDLCIWYYASTFGTQGAKKKGTR